MDQCLVRIESLQISGSTYSHSILVTDFSLRFPYGMSEFNDTIYFTQSRMLRSVNKVPETPVQFTQIYATSSSVTLAGIEVVHPEKQPPGLWEIASKLVVPC